MHYIVCNQKIKTFRKTSETSLTKQKVTTFDTTRWTNMIFGLDISLVIYENICHKWSMKMIGKLCYKLTMKKIGKQKYTSKNIKSKHCVCIF